jgi:hypothetical protein
MAKCLTTAMLRAPWPVRRRDWSSLKTSLPPTRSGVEHPVDAVLDAPVAAHGLFEALRGGRSGADAVATDGRGFGAGPDPGLDHGGGPEDGKAGFVGIERNPTGAKRGSDTLREKTNARSGRPDAIGSVSAPAAVTGEPVGFPADGAAAGFAAAMSLITQHRATESQDPLPLT